MPIPRLSLESIPDKGLAGVAKQVAQKVGSDDLGTHAASLAYRFFLALFPFAIFLAALAGFITSIFSISNPTDRIINTIGDTLPSDVTSVIRTQLDSVISSRNGALLSVGLVGTLLAASNAITSIMRSMNHAYGVRETRSFWRRYGLAVELTVFAGLMLLASFFVFIVFQAAGDKIADKIGLGGVAATLWPQVRWPIAIVGIFVAAGVLYRLAPNAKLSVRRTLPGTLLFTTVWLIATYLFGLYVSHFASYNSTYGTLGGVVILLVWFYLTAFILLVGAELNAVLQERTTHPLPQT